MGHKSVKCFGLPQMTEPREDGNELSRPLGAEDFLSSSATLRFSERFIPHKGSYSVWRVSLISRDIFIINSTKKSPSWKYNHQEFAPISLNPTFRYRTHKSTPLIPVLDQVKSILTLPSYKDIFVSSYLPQGLQGGIFIYCYPSRPYLHLSSPPSVSRTCASHRSIIWSSE